MTNPTKLRLKFASVALALLFVGWFVIGTLWTQWHRNETIVPGWLFGRLSGVVGPNYGEATVRETVEPFLVGFKSKSPGAWYWHAPTNFSYSTFEIRTSRSRSPGWETNLLTVAWPSQAFRSMTSTGILSATELRRFLVADNAPPEGSPTVADCEWLIHVLERAHTGSFPPPRHHGIKENELADSALRPPPVFDAYFQHFNLGLPMPWIVWAWLAIWIALVWIAARKWPVPRVSRSRTKEA